MPDMRPTRATSTKFGIHSPIVVNSERGKMLGTYQETKTKIAIEVGISNAGCLPATTSLIVEILKILLFDALTGSCDCH